MSGSEFSCSTCFMIIFLLLISISIVIVLVQIRSLHVKLDEMKESSSVVADTITAALEKMVTGSGSGGSFDHDFGHPNHHYGSHDFDDYYGHQ